MEMSIASGKLDDSRLEAAGWKVWTIVSYCGDPYWAISGTNPHEVWEAAHATSNSNARSCIHTLIIINTLDMYKYIYNYIHACADHTQSSQLVSTMTAFHDAPAIWTQESQTWNTRGCWDLYGMCSSWITTEWDQSPSLELAESWGGINGIPFCSASIQCLMISYATSTAPLMSKSLKIPLILNNLNKNIGTLWQTGPGML